HGLPGARGRPDAGAGRGAQARAAAPHAPVPAPRRDDAAPAGSREKLTLSLGDRFPRPSVMGVVNVTPDSFSDGGVHFDADIAVAAARRMISDGAAIVD